MTAAVDTTTGEIVDHPMSAVEARNRIARVRAGVETIREDVLALWSGRAWVALGIESWDALCDTEFGVRLALPRPERIALVTDLRGQGMSTRAIGGALGVSGETVRRDLSSTDTNVAVETVTSLDGRQRPVTQPRPAQPPLTQEQRDHRDAVRRNVNRIENFLHGFDCAAHLAQSPMRDDVLAALDPFDRERFLRIEQETSWPSTMI